MLTYGKRARKRYQGHPKILILNKGEKNLINRNKNHSDSCSLNHLLRIELTTTKCKEDYLDSAFIISLLGPPRQHWPHTILEQEWHQGNKFMLISDCSEAKVMTTKGAKKKHMCLFFFKISLIHRISFSSFLSNFNQWYFQIFNSNLKIFLPQCYFDLYILKH